MQQNRKRWRKLSVSRYVHYKTNDLQLQSMLKNWEIMSNNIYNIFTISMYKYWKVIPSQYDSIKIKLNTLTL